MKSLIFRQVLTARVSWFVLIFASALPVIGQSHNTAIIELGIEPGADQSHGMRRQVVDPGVTIHWINGDDPQGMRNVPVTIAGNANPCGLQSQDVLGGVCQISETQFPQEFYYYYCANLVNLACAPSFVSGRFHVRIKGSGDTVTDKVGPDVFIALTSDGQVNQVVHTGDTIIWLDVNGKPQDVTFKTFHGFEPFDPCVVDKLSPPDQRGPCQIRVPAPQAYAYKCLGDTCADPIIHLVKGGGGGLSIFTPLIQMLLEIVLGVAVLVSLGFGVRRLRQGSRMRGRNA